LWQNYLAVKFCALCCNIVWSETPALTYLVWIIISSTFRASSGSNLCSLISSRESDQYVYRIAGKFGESSLIRQTYFWQNLFIRLTFFHQLLKTNKFAKLLPRQTFPLYGICQNITLNCYKKILWKSFIS